MAKTRLRKRNEEAAQVLEAAEKPDKEELPKILRRKDLLSSGSTLLNLACSNNPFGAFMKGKYYFLVGDSTSGKTFLSMTCFAEAMRHPFFKDYRLIYDNVEDGCLMDLEKLFGRKVADTVEPPAFSDDDEPVYSFMVEEFYYHLDDAIKEAKSENGKPFIYILDSMDSLSSEAEDDKFEEHKKAHEKGTQAAGSYGDGKAKKNSTGLRRVLNGLRDTGSILMIISQTRDNLGFGFEKKTRAGGHGLKFYATTEIWTSCAGEIKKTVRGQKRSIGVKALCKVKKNRITGERHEVGMEIYPSYGIDDIGSCVDYLIEEKWWHMKKQSIVAEEFDITATREKLIAHIESNKLAKELQRIVGNCWLTIKEACDLKRTSKYGDEDEE